MKIRQNISKLITKYAFLMCKSLLIDPKVLNNFLKCAKDFKIGGYNEEVAPVALKAKGF